jgi:hypothetical protein
MVGCCCSLAWSAWLLFDLVKNGVPNEKVPGKLLQKYCAYPQSFATSVIVPAKWSYAPVSLLARSSV